MGTAEPRVVAAFSFFSPFRERRLLIGRGPVYLLHRGALANQKKALCSGGEGALLPLLLFFLGWDAFGQAPIPLGLNGGRDNWHAAEPIGSSSMGEWGRPLGSGLVMPIGVCDTLDCPALWGNARLLIRAESHVWGVWGESPVQPGLMKPDINPIGVIPCLFAAAE